MNRLCKGFYRDIIDSGADNNDRPRHWKNSNKDFTSGR